MAANLIIGTGGLEAGAIRPKVRSMAEIKEWDYRVILTRTPAEEGEPEVTVHSIHIAYYRPFSVDPDLISAAPIGPIGTSAEELKADWARFEAAFKKPFLDGAGLQPVNTTGVYGIYREGGA